MPARLSKLAHGRPDPRQLAREATKDQEAVCELMKGLGSDQAYIRFGSAKALRILSEERPELLYPKFDFFVRLLDHQNKILQWEAAFVLSQLARVDRNNKFATIFERYFSPIPGPVMITTANVIQGGARIAKAKPNLAGRIAAEVLKVARARYKTPECRNIAIGHAIVALGEFVGLLKEPGPALRFVRRQLKNARPATRKKAEQFLASGITHDGRNCTSQPES
jgi:hypothetical protein